MGYPSLRKPTSWAVVPALTAPKWEWFWAKASLACLPNDTLNSFDIVDGINGVVSNSGGASTSVYGSGPMFSSGGGSNRFTYANKPSGQVRITFGMVLVNEGNADEGTFFSTSEPGNSGFRLSKSTGGLISFTLGGVALLDTSVIDATVGEEYFVAASFDSLTNSYVSVLKSLHGTDFETNNTTETANPNTGDGNYTVGGSTIGSADGTTIAIGMAAIIDDFVPLNTLIDWARDPFGPFRRDDALDAGVVYAIPAAVAGGAKGPFGHPFTGAFGGPF